MSWWPHELSLSPKDRRAQPNYLDLITTYTNHLELRHRSVPEPSTSSTSPTMTTFFQSFRSSTMPKRLLRYALSRLELLEEETLDMDNLEFALGRNTIFEFKDVGVRLKASHPPRSARAMLPLTSTSE